jgi:Tol biopolymer transport system component
MSGRMSLRDRWAIVFGGLLLFVGFLPAPAVAHPPGDFAFYKWDGEGGGSVYRGHPDGSAETDLAPYAPYFSDGELAISPDGARVAFYGRGEFRTNIFVQHFSQDEPTQLTQGPGIKEGPSWSPDGRKIVADCGRQLCVMRSNGDGDPRKLTHNDYGENSPEWAPNGRWIVFSTDKGLMKIHPDGSKLRRLTRVGVDSEPQWSPDSDLIVFNRDRARSSRLFRIRVNGDGLKALTEEQRRRFDAEQDWAADGSRLVFVRKKPVPNEDYFCAKIWTIKPNGDGATSISDCFFGASFSLLNPVWSPDSERIAYIARHRPTPNADRVDDVFSINREGSDRRQMTNTADTFATLFGLDW